MPLRQSSRNCQKAPKPAQQVMEMLYGKWHFTEREYDYGAVAFSFEEYFEVDAQVRKQAKKAGILLDDTPWVGMELGLPYHFPFLVKHKNGLK